MNIKYNDRRNLNKEIVANFIGKYREQFLKEENKRREELRRAS